VRNGVSSNQFYGETGALSHEEGSTGACTAPGVDPRLIPCISGPRSSPDAAAGMPGAAAVQPLAMPIQPSDAMMTSAHGGGNTASDAAAASPTAPTATTLAVASAPAPPGSSTLPPGSSISAGTTSPAPATSPASPPPVHLSPPRPRTRLQDDIRKPKIYTDGQVRYGFFNSAGEPHNVEEALHNKNWKAAMDVECND
jgi:hypothetical protein